MKGRKWPLWIGVTLCAVVIGWMGAVAFYHFRVRSLLQGLRSEVERERTSGIRKLSRALDLLLDLEDQGCRALPDIVDEFQSDAPPEYLAALSTPLRDILFRCSDDEPEEVRSELWRTLRAVEVNGGDPPAEVRRKCDGLHRWWTTIGYHYHQNWRFWTTACPVR